MTCFAHNLRLFITHALCLLRFCSKHALWSFVRWSVLTEVFFHHLRSNASPQVRWIVTINILFIFYFRLRLMKLCYLSVYFKSITILYILFSSAGWQLIGILFNYGVRDASGQILNYGSLHRKPFWIFPRVESKSLRSAFQHAYYWLLHQPNRSRIVLIQRHLKSIV